MPEVIVFPDAEETFRAHLEATLPLFGKDIPVSCTVPNPRPAEFVRIYRVGGPKRDLVTDNASLAFEYWAQLGSTASAGINLVRGIVAATVGQVIGGVTVYSVSEFAGPVLLPDPDTAQQRYTFTASTAVRGSVRDRED
jgi:hypothetical protein